MCIQLLLTFAGHLSPLNYFKVLLSTIGSSLKCNATIVLSSSPQGVGCSSHVREYFSITTKKSQSVILPTLLAEDGWSRIVITPDFLAIHDVHRVEKVKSLPEYNEGSDGFCKSGVNTMCPGDKLLLEEHWTVQLNSRNYEEYKNNKNVKRTSNPSRNGGSSRVPNPTNLQRDWDFVDVLQYFRNERLVILQFRCFFDDGPCDWIGRWAKDRVIPGFFGICEMCTPTQSGWFDLYWRYLSEKFPDLLRSAMIRYLLSLGIDVPPDEVQYMYNVFQQRRYGPFTIQRIDL
ncbi:unnamed protein product [Allacma fusca]|uniref:Uncharacterized protein n=1 Tax=Allacma fusca TaxID=39272 RepID=A0A8J2JKB8_9HEXA|nr:unnamed protein product [Allacma fusca]